MDPNLPQSSPLVKPFSKRSLTIIVVITVIAVILIVAALIYSQKSFKKEPVQKTIQTQNLKPSPSSISKPAPALIETKRGIISKLISSSLTIKTGTSSATFDISQTKDFQKLVSGTLEGGDAKTATASAKDLKVNQEVKIISTIKEPNSAAAVLIIK